MFVITSRACLLLLIVPIGYDQNTFTFSYLSLSGRLNTNIKEICKICTTQPERRLLEYKSKLFDIVWPGRYTWKLFVSDIKLWRLIQQFDTYERCEKEMALHNRNGICSRNMKQEPEEILHKDCQEQPVLCPSIKFCQSVPALFNCWRGIVC